MSYRIGVAPYKNIDEPWLDAAVRRPEDVKPVVDAWAKTWDCLRLFSDTETQLLTAVRREIENHCKKDYSVWISGTVEIPCPDHDCDMVCGLCFPTGLVEVDK